MATWLPLGIVGTGNTVPTGHPLNPSAVCVKTSWTHPHERCVAPRFDSARKWGSTNVLKRHPKGNLLMLFFLASLFGVGIKGLQQDNYYFYVFCWGGGYKNKHTPKRRTLAAVSLASQSSFLLRGTAGRQHLGKGSC